MFELLAFLIHHLTFKWQGGMFAIIFHQERVAVRLLKRMYGSFIEQNDNIAGLGHVLNFLLQSVVVTLGAGYITGTVAVTTGGELAVRFD